MRKFCVVFIVVCCSLAFTSRAQDATNAPTAKTEIENFELQTGTVIVKGLGEIGSVTTSAGIVSVLKESIDVKQRPQTIRHRRRTGPNQLHGFLGRGL